MREGSGINLILQINIGSPDGSLLCDILWGNCMYAASVKTPLRQTAVFAPVLTELWHILRSFFAQPRTVLKMKEIQNVDKSSLTSWLPLALLGLGRRGGQHSARQPAGLGCSGQPHRCAAAARASSAGRHRGLSKNLRDQHREKLSNFLFVYFYCGMGNVSTLRFA